MIKNDQNWFYQPIHLLLAIGLTALLTGCQPFQTQDKIEPTIIYTAPESVCQLPTAFSPLSEEETQQEWSKELIIGDAFARELDLYRAITCYKRALVLLPSEAIERKLQISYDLILTYYLGHKYQEAINIFEASELTEVNPLFPAFNNLLLILYDCYRETCQEEKMEAVFEAIQKCSPETAEDLMLFSHLKEGRLTEAQIAICAHRNVDKMQPALDTYYSLAKSPSKARFLNAVLPGAGYYYVGQRRSALTSFVINTLFTAAAYQFFHRGYIAAGLITTSLEAGWYLGGINGAGIEAQEFNNRLYEGMSKQILTQNQFFPVLMFETSF